ncbi:hypothetical protein HDU92_003515 [Lobulomyces angularis]|nr:hypothetical protein HDU92_003515 [Lobulomyces angularis]
MKSRLEILFFTITILFFTTTINSAAIALEATIPIYFPASVFDDPLTCNALCQLGCKNALAECYFDAGRGQCDCKYTM